MRGETAAEDECIDCGSVGMPLNFGYPLARCTGCGLTYGSNWRECLDEAAYDYYSSRLDWPPDSFVTPANTRALKGVLARLDAQAPGKTLLDVGCGEGILVHVAAQAGWSARGIDLSESAVRIGTDTLGADCRVIDFFSKDVGSGWYAVAMVEFMEHVPQPSRFLSRAYDVLEPGGVLYVTTPNFDALSRRVLGSQWAVFGREHIGYFTSAVLRRKATAVGFRVITMRSKNIGEPTLRRLIHRHEPLFGTSEEVTSGAAPETQALRRALEANPASRAAKVVANAVLRVTRSGDTLEAILVKPTGVKSFV